MKLPHLLLCAALGLPLPMLAADPAACAALAGEIDTNLKEAALARMLAATAREPEVAAANRRSADTLLQIVDRNRRMLQENGCPAYTGPLDTTGYRNDALRCAYDRLKQRTDTPPCDTRNWTVKGPSETWHSFD